MMNPLFSPNIIVVDITKYLETILSVSGVLLGLAFAAITYVLQNGFSTFKYNRIMFLKLYINFGKKILFTLSYLVLISILRLFFISNGQLLLIVHVLFSLIFIKSILDYRSHLGYIHTIFSNKFVPKNYGPTRTYFRYIKNLGFIGNIWMFFQVFLFTCYPIIVSVRKHDQLLLDESGLVLSTGLFLMYSILIIGNFIPDFFKISIKEYETKVETENSNSTEISDVDYQTEKKTLKCYFESNLIYFGLENVFLLAEGKAYIDFPINERSEAWFNIYLEEPKLDPIGIRRQVEEFSHKFFRLCMNSNSDINSYVLSFHIRIEDKSRNIFFRSIKSELEQLFQQKGSPQFFIKNLNNKVFDDLFRDL